MRWPSGTQPAPATPALLSGGALGGVLLVWLMLTLFAPGLGSVIAVFGSPVFAFFVILRLLTLGPSSTKTGRRGVTASIAAADPDLLARVLARDGSRCSSCLADGPLRLRAVLPVGNNNKEIERRFVVVCERCYAARLHSG